MRPFTHVIPFDEARRLVREAARPIERTESVALADAAGRVAAADVVATADVPPFDRAAMDGYAAIAADTVGAGDSDPRVLALTGDVFPGRLPPERLRPGTCMAIATGAPIPDGADAVVMVEHTERIGDRIRVRREARPGQHIGRRGGDLAAGDTVVASGGWLSPARIGALAAAGHTEVQVFDRPVVALVSTGDELVEPGVPLTPGRIYNSNGLTLAALISAHGGIPRRLAAVRDTLPDLEAALDEAVGTDMVVFSGGSSVGDRDLVTDLVTRRGQVRFHGIAVKPGKPTLFADVNGVPVFGMPGNPTSCLSNGYLLLVPFLRAVARLPAWRPQQVEVPLARDVRSPADRHQFYTVRLAGGLAEPAFKGSSDITSMAHADGYIEIPAGAGPIAAGTPVVVTLFG